jgi:hypothetical protein
MDPKKTLIIDWVRHAESCSNFDQNAINDTRPDGYTAGNNIGYDPIINTNKIIMEEKKSIVKTPTQLKAGWKYHPNLSFIGMQHGIMLGTDYVQNNKYDAVFVSPTVRTVMTALMACRNNPNLKIYVVPYIVEHQNFTSYANSDYQNTPVESTRLKRIIAFIKDWLGTMWIKYFDDIELISLLTEFKNMINMSAKYEIESQILDEIKKCTIAIDNILLCKPNTHKITTTMPDKEYGTQYAICITQFFENLTILHKLVDGMGDVVQAYMRDTKPKILSTKVSNLIGIILDENKRNTYYRSIPVDFSILEHFEKNKGAIESEWYNFDNFYKQILPYVFAKNILQNDKPRVKILCVSHGAVLRTYFSEKYKQPKLDDMLNTQVFEETLSLKQYNITEGESINFTKYIPKKLRQQYQNFEILNMNVCATESVKGVINYPLWDIAKERQMIPFKNSMTSSMYYPKDYATPDVVFSLAQKYSGKADYWGTSIAAPEDIKYYDDTYKNTIIKGGSKYAQLYIDNKLSYTTIKTEI